MSIYIELQNKIHDQNVKMGWWDKPRGYKTMAALFHSELSEAMEGDRKDLMDDHLPNYKMYWVELADFAIRCMDYLGYYDHDDYDYWIEVATTPIEFICDMHSQVSSFVNSMSDPYYSETSQPLDCLSYAVMACFSHAKVYEVDLMKITKEKIEYNKNRADHKLENRAKANGKKY